MPNDFCHMALNTDDVGTAKKFYSGLFDWKLEDVPMGPGTYTMIQPGSGPGGGMQKKPMPEAPNAWLLYVQVGDVDATVAKAKQLGGQVVVPKTPIPGMGHFAIITDPSGAALGVWAK
jgi:hypothetical protein